jgi:hypothetical protein
MALPGGESADFFLSVGDVTNMFEPKAAVALTHPSNSTNSIDDILNGEDGELPTDAWQAELRTRIEQITNLKRSTTEGRAESLHTFAHILMARYAKDEIESHMSDLLPSIMRSIKQETTERETTMALRGTHPQRS